MSNKLTITNDQITVAFDMDSTLCNIIDPWLADYNKEFNDNLTSEDILDFNIGKFVKEEAKDQILKYITTEGFYKRVKPITDWVTIARRLHNQGHNVVVCSSVMNNPIMIQGKIEWLKEHMHFISKDNIMFVNNKGLLRADWLYDDKLENITDFLENNPEAKGELIRTPANREDIKKNTLYKDRIFTSKKEY